MDIRVHDDVARIVHDLRHGVGVFAYDVSDMVHERHFVGQRCGLTEGRVKTRNYLAKLDR